jgi:inner membrane protein
MRFGWLVLLAYLGTATHPILDLLTTYSVQLFSPFSSAWYHSDALFIIDIWVWLLLAIAIGISKKREQKGREWRRIPQAAIAVLIVYIGANVAISQVAYAHVRAADPRAEAMFASPPPVMSWRRDLVWRDGPDYCRASFDPLGAGFRLGSCTPSNMGDPLVREAIRRDPRLQKFLKWSVLPQADLTRERCNVRVAIGDARYGEGRRSRLARESVIPAPGNRCHLDKPSTNS